MARPTTDEIIKRAWKARTLVPSFNIPYLPMMEPVVRALRDARCFGLIAVARLEWIKFQARSLSAIRDEYEKTKDERYTRLHLDHVPVIDEDGLSVDFMADIGEALELGYESVMVDGSRLSLDDNISATRRAVDVGHAAGVAVEAELGAVMGHEEGPMPPYDELFESGMGFTDAVEARRFVDETQVDWLSVAVGSVHGAVSKAKKDEKKVEAKLSIEQIEKLSASARVPFVLHGGSGIRKQYVLDAVARGIAKINVGTAIRQPYERASAESVEKGRQATYEATLDVIRNELEIEGSAAILNPDE